jgi:DnaJ-class molecular chaperone
MKRFAILTALFVPVLLLAADAQRIPKGTKVGDVIRCDHCEGLGGFKLVECPDCKGAGQVKDYPIGYERAEPRWVDCRSCSGKGKVLVPCRYEAKFDAKAPR